MAPKKRQYFDLSLGLFVALGISVLIAVVFLIGRERRLFDTRIDLQAHFPNVAGLAVGADVMLAGVVVGYVSAIKFPILSADMPGMIRDVTVIMKISKRSTPWIREDSIARIDSKGLLGDKLINISIGSPELLEAQPGAMLQSAPPLDFNKALEQAQEILENVTETVVDAKDIFKGFVASGGDAALANAAKSIQRILKEIETGNGALHELVFDKDAGKDTKSILKNTKDALAHMDKVLADAEQLLKGVTEGKGFLHALIFDEKGEETIASLSAILKEIKEEDKKSLFSSLNSAAADLASITDQIKSGRGSLGLLINDASLYNEIYGILGNLRRNRLLKALIRYNISKKEASAP